MTNSLLIPALITILIAVGYVTRHQPLTTERNALNQERIQLEERARINRESALAYINNLRITQEALQTERNNITNPIPQTVEASDAVRTLRNLSNTTGFTITTITLNEPTNNLRLRELNITITGNGSFQETTAFLQGIQTNPEPIRINSTTLRPTSITPDPIIDVNTTLTFLSYDQTGGQQ
jgi:Tfp pilus assembly protein PilO